MLFRELKRRTDDAIHKSAVVTALLMLSASMDRRVPQRLRACLFVGAAVAPLASPHIRRLLQDLWEQATMHEPRRGQGP